MNQPDHGIESLIKKTKYNAKRYFYMRYRKAGIEKDAADMQAKMDMNGIWIPAIRYAAKNNIPLTRHVLKSLERSFRISLFHEFNVWGKAMVENGWVENC